MSASHKHVIVIPLHPGGGKLRDNSELRYALRSLERHFTEPFEVVIVAPRVPEWLQGVRHLQQAKGGLKSALVMAAREYPAGFFWVYDDLCLVRDTTAAEMKVTPACRKWRAARTKWARSLEKIHQRLVQEGHAAYDYSRPHGPYWFDQGMVDEGFRDWPGMASKFPWESWILSKRRWPRCHGVVKQYYGGFRGAPGERMRYVNFNDRGFSPELRGWLAERFPKASRFERVEAGTLMEPSRRVKLEVHSIRYGDAWWLRLCGPTLDAWCARHGHPLKIWDKSNIDPSYPAPKFCEVDMLREFLAGANDWLLYVDADVYVDAAAPAHPEPSADFLIREDLPGRGPGAFKRWCKRHRKPIKEWQYRNAGVWMCSREGAQRMLEVMKAPFIEGFQEQHHFNWWISQAVDAGMDFSRLPPAWNAWAWENTKGAFYHIAGQHKVERLKMFRADGRIPTPPQPSPGIMKTFDDSKYPVGSDANMEVDDIHLHALHAACSLDTGKPAGQRVVVEIGAFRGRSTTAFVEALHAGLIGHLHVVELEPTKELRRVIEMAPPNTVTLHTTPFWNAGIQSADICFIDGDHRWPALADTLCALTLGVKVICMHDTQAWPRFKSCWGSTLAGKLLKQSADRDWIEDSAEREGTRTFRGLLISVQRGIDLAAVRDCLQITSPALA